MRRHVRWSFLLAGLLGGCVLDDGVGEPAEEPRAHGVEPVEGAVHDPVDDSWSVERSFDLQRRNEAEELVETMRER